MTKLDEFPDENWIEEDIVLLLKTAQDSSVKSREKRIACLYELRKRTIENISEVSEALIETAQKHCWSDPESTMIISILSNLANLDEKVFQKLLDATKEAGDVFLHCISMIIRNLDKRKKKRSIKPLLTTLMSKDSFTTVTEEMCETIASMDKEIAKETVAMVSPYLRLHDPFKVVYAVKITSRLASAELIPKLELVIERALTGWYMHARKEEILTNICSYFRRIKDERSTPHLLQILKSNFNRERVASKALARVVDAHPEAIDKIWDFLQKEKEHYFPILMTFEEMETSIDVERLFSLVDINLGIQSIRQILGNIIIKAGKQAKPLLLRMVKDEHHVRYTFALECLEKTGVSIEEYSKVFEKSPILQIYEFFYEKKKGMLLENLWKKQDKLGDSIKHAQMGRFEYFIDNVFSALGFVTLFVDPAGKKGVDLVAFSPNEPYILIIGCTTGVIQFDLQNLNITTNEMKEALRELFARYRILPMVITSEKVEVYPIDSEYAGKNNIAILTQKEVTALLKMLRTNRRSSEIIKYVKQSIPPFSIKP